jgi:hypothetical protein
VFSSVFPASADASSSAPASVESLPIGLPEYIADCDGVLDLGEEGSQGNPTVLALNIGTTFRNIAAADKKNLSLSVDWWSHVQYHRQRKHRYHDNDDDDDDDDLNSSPANFPRASIFGYLSPLSTPLTPSTQAALESCFLASHPDAKYWLPGSGAVHSGFWARLIVQEVYWIGGFGDRARIGWVNMTEWRGVRKSGGGGGDDGAGRGWEDVRLPGEEGGK